MVCRDPNRSEFESEIKRATTENRPAMFTGSAVNLDLSGLNFAWGYPSSRGPSTLFFDFYFRENQMTGCNLTNCSLSHCRLYGVDLGGSTLRGTAFGNTRMSEVNLDDCDLTGANFFSSTLTKVSLQRANVKEAIFGETAILGVDLSDVNGLPDVYHYGPSAIDGTSLDFTVRHLANQPEHRRRDLFAFLSGIGLNEDLVQAVRSRVDQPIEFHSIFLSHSSRDKEFARKLYRDLSDIKIKCWLDEKELLPGDSVLGEIDKGIKLWDRLLLVCSLSSLGPTTGWWVEQELERALAKERELRRQGVPGGTVIPITIDDYIFDEWDGKYKSTLLERYIGDFRDQSPESYDENFERLVKSLDRSRRS
jgi:TIR domain/Pentapeptide repeats (9 copies)